MLYKIELILLSENSNPEHQNRLFSRFSERSPELDYLFSFTFEVDFIERLLNLEMNLILGFETALQKQYILELNIEFFHMDKCSEMS